MCWVFLRRNTQGKQQIGGYAGELGAEELDRARPVYCENAHVPSGNDNDQNLLRHSASKSVSQLFHGPAPRSTLHRLAVRLRTNSDERADERRHRARRPEFTRHTLLRGCGCASGGTCKGCVVWVSKRQHIGSRSFQVQVLKQFPRRICSRARDPIRS